MVKVNHHSLKYKKQSQPNKRYKDLKQKQKAKIADWMYRETCKFYSDMGRMPTEEDEDKLTKMVYQKICSVAIWVPYEEVIAVYKKKLPIYAKRIVENGLIVEEPVKKDSNTIVRGMRKKRKHKMEIVEEITQNDRFYYIAGHTSGGAQ